MLERPDDLLKAELLLAGPRGRAVSTAGLESVVVHFPTSRLKTTDRGYGQLPASSSTSEPSLPSWLLCPESLSRAELGSGKRRRCGSRRRQLRHVLAPPMSAISCSQTPTSSTRYARLITDWAAIGGDYDAVHLAVLNYLSTAGRATSGRRQLHGAGRSGTQRDLVAQRRSPRRATNLCPHPIRPIETTLPAQAARRRGVASGDINFRPLHLVGVAG